jgi:MEMO1 family protein
MPLPTRRCGARSTVICSALRRPTPACAPKMLLVPHAGFRYSGAIAAQAYGQLKPWRERIRRVVLLGPTHRVAVRGLAAPSAQAFDRVAVRGLAAPWARAFETPLGRVAVDSAALAALAALPQVGTSDAAHAQEHSLEVQLPFLQRALGAFTLVPLAVGRASAEEVAEVLERLWGGDETLIVISSDLSHYLPYAQAQAKDRATVDRILRLDPALDHEQACGATPLAGALLAARAHGLGARLLDLRNSGDTAGDRARVVGYCAIAFEPAAPATDGDAEDERAGADDDSALGDALLVRAHNTIAAALNLPTGAEPPHPRLAAHGATFVTLQHRGALRGCIGTLQAVRPLDEDVRVHALAAAFRDPRFAPLTLAEYFEVDVEVSLLDPAEPLPVRSEAEALRLLRPQIDGVVLEWRGRRATFLPQVWAQLPAADDFIAALKRKAGLAVDFWAEDLRLSRYRVRKFSAQEMSA